MPTTSRVIRIPDDALDALDAWVDYLQDRDRDRYITRRQALEHLLAAAPAPAELGETARRVRTTRELLANRLVLDALTRTARP